MVAAASTTRALSTNQHPSLTVDALATCAGLRQRLFARAFHTKIRTTPARMLEKLRIEEAE